jgi:hypothetical protein
MDMGCPAFERHGDPGLFLCQQDLGSSGFTLPVEVLPSNVRGVTDLGQERGVGTGCTLCCSALSTPSSKLFVCFQQYPTLVGPMINTLEPVSSSEKRG